MMADTQIAAADSDVKASSKKKVHNVLLAKVRADLKVFQHETNDPWAIDVKDDEH
jgi:hypothetical protein